VELVLGSDRIAMQSDTGGFWSRTVASMPDGARYGFALDGDTAVLPDPASRFQPDGPHGMSEVVDPTRFEWSDACWAGLEPAGQVIYELHVGTFTAAGTWEAARGRLPDLKTLGVTVVELMPVADFPGRFGWGYDGVNLYAPHHHYGRPDDLRRFIDAAHGLGLGVLLDVVYNHVGPEGNHLPAFTPHYFSKRETEWGAAFNYDGDHCAPVRAFIAGNAEHWIREYHFDGLRLDATQSVYDDSDEHILAELARKARAAAAGRSILLVAENEPQETRLVRPAAEGGYGLDALWNDDLHHSALVALTGRREAYYSDYRGRASELVAALKYGYLYQGQHYVWQKKRRGTPTYDLPTHAFVAFLENHDQVANSPRGERLRYRSHPAAHRALTSLLLLGPWTPMLFQGQEWASDRRFVFFADLAGPLAGLVQRGRAEFMTQFPSYASRAIQEALPEPGALASFESCKLDWGARQTTSIAQESFALHRDLLAIRHGDPVLRAALRRERTFEAAVLTDHALALRYFDPEHDDDRLLLINLGHDLDLVPAPEPLLAPPSAASWSLMWASEEPQYGGYGVPESSLEGRGWHLPAYSALLFKRGEPTCSTESARHPDVKGSEGA